MSHKKRPKNLSWVVRSGACLIITAALLLAVGDSPSHAGDFPEHWHLIYYAARVAGYTQDDARLIADASWGMDQNNDTVEDFPQTV